MGTPLLAYPESILVVVIFIWTDVDTVQSSLQGVLLDHLFWIIKLALEADPAPNDGTN